MSDELLKPLYTRDGEWIVPGSGAHGPWSPALQSGHAVAGIAMTLVEEVPTLVPMLAVRCVLNLTRPVPMAPCRWRAEIIREGKQLQMVRVTLEHEGAVVSDLTVLRMRVGESPAVGGDKPYPALAACEQVPLAVADYEVRTPGGKRFGHGPGAFWMRMPGVRVLGDRPITPLVHAMMLADWGGGMASELAIEEWRYPNVDITLHLFREPEGEWLLLEAETESAGLGVSLASSLCADQRGVFGRCHQTLIVDHR